MVSSRWKGRTGRATLCPLLHHVHHKVYCQSNHINLQGRWQWRHNSTKCVQNQSLLVCSLMTKTLCSSMVHSYPQDYYLKHL